MNTKCSSGQQNIRYLKGIGPKRALALEKFGIFSVRDLLYFFPRRYEDRSQFRSIQDAQVGESATLRGEVLSVRFRPLKNTSLVEVTVGDSTATIHAVWFNQPYLKNYFTVGQEIILFGKVEWYQKRFQIASPEYEILDREEEAVHTGRITPVYPLTEGLFQKSLRAAIYDAVQTQLTGNISDPLPPSFREEKNLLELQEAVREMHFPSAFDKQAEARKRIVFDEFFLFELRLLKKIEQFKSKFRAYAFRGEEQWLGAFRDSLHFCLTRSQESALQDLGEDLKLEAPMNRLLQGDVGSGKTVVAAFALLLAAKNELQGAILVPTEILAEQHYRTLQAILRPFDIPVGLLTSSITESPREKLLAQLRQGKLPVIVGTHALLQEDVRFNRLALVVIDEQHKFGVHQRCQLFSKDPRPHQLVMTATPIPRTLALTTYGDLSVSFMRELPAGRKQIKTYWITRKKQPEILKHILEKVKHAEQAFFIFPLIEETEKTDWLAAKREYESLRKGVFSGVKMGLVHGRLMREERETVMKAFRGGEIQVLVATSVVEVGVDNPNATIMVIENAERFGLSQLHQMRGRIGRGEKASICFLFGEPKTTEGQKRLRILTKTQDGFLIAEEDLKLRGPGDFWGTRQSGEPFFRIADPVSDEEILLEARDEAMLLVRTHALERTSEWGSMKQFLEENPLRY